MYLGDNQNHVSAELNVRAQKHNLKKTKGKYYYCVKSGKTGGQLWELSGDFFYFFGGVLKHYPTILG
jgi:hypothetical protein